MGNQDRGSVDSESLSQSLVVNPSLQEDSRASATNDQIPVKVPGGGEYAKSIVYGGLDAIVTSFALVSSISGGDYSSGAVLVLGFANLIADGISMGFGDYVSTKTERDLASSQQTLTSWEIGKDPHSQLLDLVTTYKSYGMDERDAIDVVETFSKYKHLLVDEKLTLEQGMVPPDSSDSPWKHGLVTFVSFIGFGCTPLLTYVVLNPFTSDDQLKFGVACGVTALALIILGLAKAKISGQKYFMSVVMILLNGGFAAAVAYLIGWLLRDVLGIED